MATLKQHQEAMVQLLANGNGIPASASRLAHAMHDVLSAMLSEPDLIRKALAESDAIRRAVATTPGLNDKALAGDIEACRPKATPAERRVKELENTVKQLRANNAKLREQIAENAEAVDLWKRWSAEPEQAGCRKLDTQVCEHEWKDTGRELYCKRCGVHPSDLPDTQVCSHDSWEDVAHGDKRCCDCGELFK